MANISSQIKKEVKPGDLRIRIPEIKDNSGKVLRKATERTVSENMRAVHLARVETIRASNEGALNNYKNNGIAKAQWIAAIGERTCPYCESQNGIILDLIDARERIPSHVACRCSFAPVIE